MALWLRWLKRKEKKGGFLSNRTKRGPWRESVPHTWEPRKTVQPRGEALCFVSLCPSSFRHRDKASALEGCPVLVSFLSLW